MPQTADQIVVEVTALVGPYTQAMVQVANVTINNMKAAEQAAEKGSGTIGKALETIAGRVPDLIRNLGDGQNALHLFLQEGAQILPVFGVWGVVLGGVVGAIDAVAANLGVYETAADRAKAAQEAFNTAAEVNRGLFTEQEQKAIDYAKSLSLVEQGYLGIAKTSTEVALRKLQPVLDDALTDVRKQINDIQEGALRLSDSATGFKDTALADRFRQFADAFQQAVDIVNAADPQPADFERLNNILVGLRDQAKGLKFDLGALDEIVVKAALAVKDHADQMAVLEAVHKRIDELTKSWASGLQALGINVGGLVGRIGNLSGALGGLIAQFLQLDSVTPGDGPVFGVGTSQTIKVLEDRAKLLDGTRAGNERARIAAQAAAEGQKAWNDTVVDSSSIGGVFLGVLSRMANYQHGVELATKNANRELQGQGQGQGKAAPAAAPRKPDGDAALDKIRQEIDLNNKLIAVYKNGPEARDRERAAYDALNAARERGLKAGSREYNLYLQQYQSIAERLYQSKQLLAEHARGEELTKSVQTAEEKRLVTLGEYNRLRAEGAITEETHQRLLEKLNAENTGYAEGLQAIGQAIQGGIQGATSFSDALTKVGISLAQLLLQAALFGSGPLGKAFGNLTGLAGGLLGIGTGSAETVFGETVTNALTGTGGLYARGGNPPVGIPSIVGEAGPELFVPRVPGTIIPTQMSQRLLSGHDAGSGQPITFNISLAGANGDRTIAEIAAAAVKKGLGQVPEINRQHRIRFA